MASAVQSLRLCLRTASKQAASPTKIAPRQYLKLRSFSSTPFQQLPAAKKDDSQNLEEELGDGDMDTKMDPAQFERALEELRQNSQEFDRARNLQEQMVGDANRIISTAMRTPRVNKQAFWNDEEADTDLIADETNADKFEEDDIMSMAHAKFEEFREYREYARIAAWQMPLLSKLATPFEAPTAQELLRFRYTSYMGEFHPAEKKVVVEFCPQDMPLDEAQKLKLRKLLGARWNPETDIAKMSCEQFEHPAQNKRYLGDLVNKLVEQAKDPTDMFEDIPLDTRHHTFKTKPKFPKEWRMTEERRQFLEETRQKALLLDQAKEQDGTIVNGVEKINRFFNPPKSERKDQIPEFAAARLSQSLSAHPPRKQHRYATR
ncbi:hypothetical protein F5Y19DRAFT_415993 [Xylariaceae sp. FL1651]|nr:hypothetical protein F5Y19DRAFT_415993 [Xylariaceae sp. FL1651]